MEILAFGPLVTPDDDLGNWLILLFDMWGDPDKDLENSREFFLLHTQKNKMVLSLTATHLHTK